MSGICGIVHFDGKPVDPGVLKRMAEAAAYCGPDGITYWVENNAGFAHLALHTTPESVRERQPLVNRRGDLVLVADARVDNRDELIRTLTSKGHLEEKHPTDADLVLAAYECWGEACATHILGDFGYAIWDRRTQRLVCSRDVIGIRPLFFHQQGQTLFVATTIASILAGLGDRPPLNEPLLVDFLCWNFERWVYQTIYDGIFRVPASHTLLAREGKVTFERHWTLGAQPGPGYKKDEEYIDHFRDLFEEAVRCRLRSVGPVGISVSGGLDSSSIACMAHHMVERGDPGLPDVRLYSCVFDERYPAADEREYLQAVLDTCHRFPFKAIPGETLWGFKEMSTNGGFALDEPEIFPIRVMLTDVLRAARADGCRVVMMGEGADQILASGAYFHPEVLLDVQLSRLRQELTHFRRRGGLRSITLKLFQRLCVAPILSSAPQYIKRRSQHARQIRDAPDWVSTEKIRPVTLQELGPLSAARMPRLSQAGNVSYHYLAAGWYTALLTYEASLTNHLGVVYLYPFLDRRLVDFTLRLPADLLFNNSLTKITLRYGLEGILAEEVRQRRRSTHFSEVSHAETRGQEREQILSVLEDAARSQPSYIEADRLDEAWAIYFSETGYRSRSFFSTVFLQDWLNSH